MTLNHKTWAVAPFVIGLLPAAVFSSAFTLDYVGKGLTFSQSLVIGTVLAIVFLALGTAIGVSLDRWSASVQERRRSWPGR